MQNNIKVGDKFRSSTENNFFYIMKVININDFREPDLKYAVDVYDTKGNCIVDDVQFVSEEFLLKCERMKEDAE